MSYCKFGRFQYRKIPMFAYRMQPWLSTAKQVAYTGSKGSGTAGGVGSVERENAKKRISHNIQLLCICFFLRISSIFIWLCSLHKKKNVGRNFRFAKENCHINIHYKKDFPVFPFARINGHTEKSWQIEE